MGLQVPAEEAPCLSNHLAEAASQMVSSHRVFHQAPDALGRILFVSSVLGQPQYLQAWTGSQPRLHSLGRMGRCTVHYQEEQSGRVVCYQSLQKLHKVHRQLAVVIRPMEDPCGSIQCPKEGPAIEDSPVEKRFYRGWALAPVVPSSTLPAPGACPERSEGATNATHFRPGRVDEPFLGPPAWLPQQSWPASPPLEGLASCAARWLGPVGAVPSANPSP